MGLSCTSSKSSLVPNFRPKKDQNFLETWYYHICCFPGSRRPTHTDARSQARIHKGFHVEPCGVSVLPDAAAAGSESSRKRRSRGRASAECARRRQTGRGVSEGFHRPRAQPPSDSWRIRQVMVPEDLACHRASGPAHRGPRESDGNMSTCLTSALTPTVPTGTWSSS